MSLIAKIPLEERPRERFMVKGADALSLTELLAICLGNGRHGASALDLADELLSHFGSLSRVFEADLSRLMQIKGIGSAKAIQLKAIFALAKRLQKRVGKPKYPVRGAEDVFHFIASELEDQKQERLALLMRNSRGDIFHYEIISVGILSEVLVHPREIFHTILLHHAYSFILVHNHPTGDPRPSKSDIELTQLLEASGKMMGIPLDDHLIIGRNAYTSMWKQGFIKLRAKY